MEDSVLGAQVLQDFAQHRHVGIYGRIRSGLGWVLRIFWYSVWDRPGLQVLTQVEFACAGLGLRDSVSLLLLWGMQKFQYQVDEGRLFRIHIKASTKFAWTTASRSLVTYMSPCTPLVSTSASKHGVPIKALDGQTILYTIWVHGPLYPINPKPIW